jgi:hypothetical protein
MIIDDQIAVPLNGYLVKRGTAIPAYILDVDSAGTLTVEFDYSLSSSYISDCCQRILYSGEMYQLKTCSSIFVFTS